MKQFRKFIFWLHLIAGVVAGVIVLVMSVSGVLIAYEKQITGWADGYEVERPSKGASRLGVEALLAKAQEGQTNAPSGVVVRADAAAPVAISFGREKTVFINPYTGAVLGEGSKEARAFFRWVTEWHRWLGSGKENRALGRGITGACNLAFLFLVMSGFYLWWPRQWTKSALKAVTMPVMNLRGKARDWNWHNAIGFWSAPALFFIVITGVVMSYPWANNLLYTLTGSELPAARPGGGPGGGAGGGMGRMGEGRQGEGKRGEGKRAEGEPGPEGGRRKGEGRGEGGPRGERGERGGGAATSFDGLDKLWARAEQYTPDWQSITVRFAGAGPVTFLIDQSSGAQRPDKRAQVTLDARTGEVVRTETYDSYNAGRKLRLWSRYVHTGEAGGWIGQTLAMLVSAGAGLLVWTGFALTWRRFMGRNDKKVEAVGVVELKAREEAVVK